jgi:NitT/TauT family transport system permease protein
MRDAVVPAGQAEGQSASHAARLGRGRRLGDLLYPAATLVLVLIVWQVAVAVFDIKRYILPPPTMIAEALVNRWALLWQSTLVTAGEILMGFGLSVIVGLPLAVLTVASRLFERTVYPLIVASQAVPKMAVAPLFVAWFGFSTTPKILIAFLIAFFPIVIDSAVGLRGVPREMIWLARSIGLSPLQTFLKIRLPHALPSVFGGLKIATTLAVIGAVVGEFVGSEGGLGYLLLIANGNLDTPMLFASLLILTALGLLFYGFISLLEGLAIPWHASADSQTAGGE